jgi:PAS domain S-box-containing protein
MKLTLLMAVASTLALFLASGGFLYYDLHSFRESMATDLTTQAQIIGANCSAALSFRDPDAVMETLKSLQAKKDIRSASLFLANGKLFAKWGRTPLDLKQIPMHAQQDGVSIRGDQLRVFYSIRSGNDVEGVVCIDSSLDAWYERRDQYARIVALLTMAGGVLAIVVGSRLQRIVSRPIQDLAIVMRQVAREQDYSRRARRRSGGEIGDLTDGLNSMLDELEAQRTKLRRSNEELEVRVRERTLQLQEEISERISAEETLERNRRALEEFFENATVGLLWLGPDGRILRANQMELQTLAYTAEEYVGRPIEEFMENPEVGQEILTRLWNGETLTNHEVRMKCSDGRIKSIVIDSNVLWDGDEFIHARCFTRDVTALKAAQAMDQAREEAERASKAKSEFLSRMSHELRTPMNAILGFAQLLQLDEISGEQRESVDQIRSAGEHLLRLINEVLDISRIEAGALTISNEAVSIGDVAGEVKSLIQPLADQRGISVVLDLGDYKQSHVVADRQRLCQVLLNLVSNAVKYNRPAGKVTIAVEPRQDGCLRLCVADTGTGIRPERVNSIFMPFERLGAEQTSIEGTGLGLALSKRLVEAMGGEIGFTTSPDGSCFYIELPETHCPLSILSKPEVESIIEPAIASTNARSVLLIEDNLSNVRLIEKILSARPHVKLLVAMQGTLGYELAVEHKPDMILLDLNLPDCHGFDLLKKLKATEDIEDVSVVVVSADATPAQVARLMESGAYKYLTKPLNVKELLQTLDEILSDEERQVA